MGIIPSKYEIGRVTFPDIAAPLKTYFFNGAPGTGSTSSATFVDLPGPIDKAIVKRETATALFVSGTFSAFKTTAAGLIDFGLLIGGVDYFIARLFFNTLSAHAHIPFNAVIANAVTAGPYTARVRWRVTGGPANTDSNDVVHIRFEEGYWG